jgi:hypothetical protein
VYPYRLPVPLVDVSDYVIGRIMVRFSRCQPVFIKKTAENTPPHHTLEISFYYRGRKIIYKKEINFAAEALIR